MNNYDPQDLKSVLEYIYDSYGLSVFLKTGKLQAYFSDLAPRLSKELHMIKLLDENGILKKMSRVEVNDVVQQKKILNISKAKLTGDIPIDPAYVISFLQILSEVLRWRYLSFQDDCQKELIHHQPENPIEKSQSPKTIYLLSINLYHPIAIKRVPLIEKYFPASFYFSLPLWVLEFSM